VTVLMAGTFPRIGSALIVRDEANRILLGKRNKDPQRGSWVLPGGKIHAFESIALAAARELEEETGLKVEVESQFRVYEIINPPDEHRIVIYSWGKVTGGEPKASDDISELRFVPIRELGGMLTTPLVRQVLADAGFLSAAHEELATEKRERQLDLVVLPIVVAEGTASARSRRTRQRTHRPRTSTTFNLPLEFDVDTVIAFQ
jgi:8-oxo-dGTP diphosphatase